MARAASALTRILKEQARLPASWLDRDAWGGESPGADLGGIPEELTGPGATIDVASARRAGLPIGPPVTCRG